MLTDTSAAALLAASSMFHSLPSPLPGQGYGSYGSAQGMGGGFANQQSQHSQTPQYQSYGDSSTGTPTAGVGSSKQPAYDSYSNYNSFSQPSFGGQKADLYPGHAAQSQVCLFHHCLCCGNPKPLYLLHSLSVF